MAQTLPTRTAFLSPYVPPHEGGHANLLYRFLYDFSPDEYRLVTFNDPALYWQVPPDTIAALPVLPRRATYIPRRMPLRPYSRHGLSRVRAVINAAAITIALARDLAQFLKREHCGALFVSTGGLPPYDHIAAWIASRLVGVPFTFYVVDWWRYQAEATIMQSGLGALRPLLIPLERLFLRAADTVAVPNEAQADAYRDAYGLPSTLLRIPGDPSLLEFTETVPWPREPGKLRLVYTGQIYNGHYDSVHNLIEAVRRMDGEGVSLHLYTPVSSATFKQEGIGPPTVIHPYVAPPEVHQVQREADIIVLQLGFESPFAPLLATASPSKYAELLACGRPMLVHAPRGSFVARYTEMHECGVVVDTLDPARLVEAIRRIRSDDALRRRLVSNARARAASDFSLGTARAQLVALLESQRDGRRVRRGRRPTAWGS